MIESDILKIASTFDINKTRYIKNTPVKESEDYISVFADSKIYYRWLWAAMKVLQPKNVVELGTYRGGSTLAMLEGLPEESSITTVDKYTTHIWLEGIDDPRLHFIYGSTLDLADRFSDIDFLFIDTDHNYDQVSKEWHLYSPLVVKGGIVAFDDIHLNAGMNQFWNELTGTKVDISEYHEGAGFGFVII